VKLVDFSVSNYRSITSAHKIKFSNVTVLIGKNNEGKSNLLRALELAMVLLKTHAEMTGRRYRTLLETESDYNWKRDFPIQLQGRKNPPRTVFKLEFLLNDNEIQDFKSVIGSNLNGALPLEITIEKDASAKIRVIKQGKGAKTLSDKSSAIAKFIAQRIHFNYIPAVRTDSEAVGLIANMLSHELRSLEQDQAYLNALETISKLQQPILDKLAQRVQGPLQEFLPSIKSVKIEVNESNRRYSLRRDINLVIDDGTPTNIENKGDGVKSLAALGLLKSKDVKDGASVLAIEEPESHLHPAAIHQVNDIIRSISETSQVIITTHNPLFVDRVNVKSNIVVTDGGAVPAKNIGVIRDLLGIKASDNLTHANFALVVEGEEDALALKSLLPVLSEKVGKALKNNSLIIEPIGGAGNLSYKLSLLKNSLCATYVLLDADEAGRTSYAKAESDGLISSVSCTFVICAGMQDSEFEDCIDVEIYKAAMLSELDVDLNDSKFRGNAKWSIRLKAAFLNQGKLFDNKVCSRAKYLVAKEITRNPKNALNVHKRNSLDALVASLDRLIKM